MARIDTLTNFLTDVADSIRTKTNKTDSIHPKDFDTEISKIIGTAPNLQEKTVSASVYNNVNVVADEAYDGLSKVTIAKIKRQDKEVTPSTNVQQINPDKSYDGLASVKVNAVTSAIDANIAPNNIKENISILGVIGTAKTLISSEVTITPSFEQQIITPTGGSNGIVKAIVNPIVLNTQDKTVTPSSSQQVITKDANYDALGTVTVEPIPSNLYDITITANGTYQAPEGYLGIGTATVNVPAQGIPETQLYTYSEEDWTNE